MLARLLPMPGRMPEVAPSLLALVVAEVVEVDVEVAVEVVMVTVAVFARIPNCAATMYVLTQYLQNLETDTYT
jgi:hypothetical protein